MFWETVENADAQRLNIRPIWGMAKISMINYDHYQQDVTEEDDKWDIKKAKEWT